MLYSLKSRLTRRLTMGASDVHPNHPAAWIWMRFAGRMVAWRGISGRNPRGNPRLEDETGSIFPHVESSATAAKLWQYGYASGLDLPKEMVERLADFFAQRPCYVNGKRDKPVASADAAAEWGAVTAYYFDTMDSPDIRAIVLDPKIRNIAAIYFGATPYHLGNQAWWSFPVDASDATRSEFAQLYHFDLDAWRFLKFFFYVTDVGDGDGEHTYVLGSHRRRPLQFQLRIRRFADAEVASVFDRTAIKKVLGPSGSGFVEDTFGLHKGEPPRSRRRLYFEIEFANADFGVPNDRF